MERTADDAGECLDGAGGLAVPPFTRPRIHLGTTQTIGQPGQNRPDTLFGSVERWAQRKVLLSHENVKQRAWQTLKWQIANDVQHVRNHVDVSDPTLTALKAIFEVHGEMAPWVDLQIAALLRGGVLSYPNGLEPLEGLLRLGTDVMRAIPHLEFTCKLDVESLHKVIDLTEHYDLSVDVHCDEVGDKQSRSLEVLTMLAHRNGPGAQVIASHTTATHSYNDAYTSRLPRLLELSGISFVANPLVDTHLQDHFDNYLERRGITRVKGLFDAEIDTCFGHDSVFDSWYPLDTASMLQVPHMGLHVTQIMGYGETDGDLDLTTHNSAHTLGLREYGIEVGHLANLLVLLARDGFNAVRRQVPVRYSVRGRRLLAETVPVQTTVFPRQAEAVDFTRAS